MRPNNLSLREFLSEPTFLSPNLLGTFGVWAYRCPARLAVVLDVRVPDDTKLFFAREVCIIAVRKYHHHDHHTLLDAAAALLRAVVVQS